MQEAIEMGLENEDALEDAVSKIEMYRQLFGAQSASVPTHSRDLNSLNRIIDTCLAEA